MTQFAHRVVLFCLALLVLSVGLPLVGHLTPAATGVALAVPLDTETPTATVAVTTTTTATVEASVTPTATATVADTATATATLAASATPTATTLASATLTQTPTVTVTPTTTATPNYPLFLPLIARMPEGGPGAPTLTATASATAATLTWTAAPNARAYALWQSTSPSLADASIVYQGDALSYTVPLAPGVYYFAVQALNAQGAARSDIVTAQVLGVPSKPTLTATTSNATVTLTWTASERATSYALWQGTTPSLGDASVVYRGAALSYTTTLVPGVYYFAVQALNDQAATMSDPVGVQIIGAITGQVTQGGLPVAGIELWLRFYDGANFSTLATTRTDGNGNYTFLNPPSLAPGQQYYVRYDNPERNPARLSRWNSFRITSYTAGSTAWGGNFDVQNVTLIAPASGTTTKLPVTFSWATRNLPGDTYHLILFDPNDANVQYDSGDLGPAGSFTLRALPSGFSLSKAYGWSVRVYNNPLDPSNYGSAYYYHSITFRR